MKTVIQNYRTGHLEVNEVPAASIRSAGILVQTQVSLVSAGTERQMVELAQKNLVGKALERPDLVRRVIDKVKNEGLFSTIEAVRSRLDNPMPLGYSSAGTVIKVGERVEDFQIGDRVACAGAGYASHAEVVFVPKNLAVIIPDGVDFESASFTTLGAIALQGLRLADVRLGETVAIIGLGLVGLLTVQLAKAAGCRVVGMDPNPERCRLAQELGCDGAATDNRGFLSVVSRRSQNQGADSVVITAATKSSDPLELAGQVARDRGIMVAVGLVGMDIPRETYYKKELTFKVSRSYGPGRYDANYEEKGRDYPIGYVRWTENRNMQAFVQLLAEGKINVKPLITHRFPIEEATKAYDLITGKTKEPYLGILLTYSGNNSGQQSAISVQPVGVDLVPQSSVLSTNAPSVHLTTDNRQLTTDVSHTPCASRLTPHESVDAPSGPTLPSAICLLPSGSSAPSALRLTPSSSDPLPSAPCPMPLGNRLTPNALHLAPVRIGLLGAGEFAKGTLLPAMKRVKGIEFVGVCTASGISAQHVANKFGFSFATTDEDTIINNPDINTIVIATRHHLHARQIIAALKAGKHVFVEKPLCINEGELKEIVEVYTSLLAPHASRPLLMVGYNRRFSPMALKLKEFLADIHEPLVMHYRINAGYIPPDHWVHDPEQGGGRIIGEVCHFVDFLTFLAGSLPEKVYARSLPNNGQYSNDNLTVSIEFANGSLGTITYVANGDKSLSKEHVEVFGGGGVAVLENFRRLEMTQNGRRQVVKSWFKQDKGHYREWEPFVNALKDNNACPIPFDEIIATSVTSFSIIHSLNSSSSAKVATEESLIE